MRAFCFVMLSVFLLSCSKQNAADSPSSTDQFNQYTIPAGHHYCLGNDYREIETDEMKFIVRFDSSAIYQSIDPVNQYDINKLYGFSDNHSDHHQYSARFGWRWSDGALRLFAYVYNEGGVVSKELTTVS